MMRTRMRLRISASSHIPRPNEWLQTVTRPLSSLHQRTPKAGWAPNPVGNEAFHRLDAVQSHRRQHQLAMVDETAMHRDAMRHFVESLSDAVGTFPRTISRTPSLPLRRPPKTATIMTAVSVPVEEDELDDNVAPEEVSNELESISKHSQSPTTNVPKTTTASKEHTKKGRIEMQLGRAIRSKNARKAVQLFEQAKEKEQPLRKEVVASLFYMVVSQDPISAYSILKDYHQLPDMVDKNVDLYRKLCHAVGFLDPKQVPQRQIYDFVLALLSDLQAMDRETQEALYPRMISALATQRCVSVGHFAGNLYQYMVENDFEMAPGWLRKLLALSKYNRQEDLPFHDILARLAAHQARPHPLSTIPAIHNMFPFTNATQMSIAMKALLDIQQQFLELPVSHDTDQILIDLDCLETISTGAAHAGSPELILLIWDLLEQCNYRPTESIYENTVIAFASAGEDLEPSFGAIVSMKDDGYQVSRSLLRSFSLAVRSNRSKIDRGLHLLKSRSELLCLETLNAILSCYAERGDVRQTKMVMDVMASRGVQPDANSYSFCIEALGKDLHRRQNTTNLGMVQKNLDNADAILTMMENDGIAPSSDVIRHYIELLCIAKEVKTATAVVRQCLDTTPDAVNSKTLYRVAMTNAELGYFDEARDIASKVSDNIPIMMRKIRSIQQRFDHIEARSRRKTTSKVTRSGGTNREDSS